MSPQGRQSPGVFLGTMCNGDAQQLEDGWIMPRANNHSNSWQAILSRSGGSLRRRGARGNWRTIGGDVVGDSVLHWLVRGRWAK